MSELPPISVNEQCTRPTPKTSLRLCINAPKGRDDLDNLWDNFIFARTVWMGNQHPFLERVMHQQHQKWSDNYLKYLDMK